MLEVENKVCRRGLLLNIFGLLSTCRGGRQHLCSLFKEPCSKETCLKSAIGDYQWNKPFIIRHYAVIQVSHKSFLGVFFNTHAPSLLLYSAAQKAWLKTEQFIFCSNIQQSDPLAPFWTHHTHGGEASVKLCKLFAHPARKLGISGISGVFVKAGFYQCSHSQLISHFAWPIYNTYLFIYFYLHFWPIFCIA